MSLYSFSIILNNVMWAGNNGNASINFGVNDFPIPSGTKGLPNTLHDLASLVDAKYMTVTYSVQAAGSVSKHDCSRTDTLFAYGYTTSGAKIGDVGIVNNSNKKGGWINSGYVPIYSGPFVLMASLYVYSQCSGSGCWCTFWKYGGWSKTSIYLKIDVTVDLINYCSTNPQNLYSDLCYNFLSDYMTKSQPSPSQEISDALTAYCQQKFPGKGLSIFNDPNGIDSKDYNLCACNMNEIYYKQFLASLQSIFPSLAVGSLRAQCLFPACSVSSFKKSGLDNCPVPQCLEFVNVNDSNIAGNVVINQNADCSKQGITPTPPGPTPPGPTPPGPTPGPTPPKPVNKYRTLIIVGAITGILLLVALLIFIIFGTSSKKSPMQLK